MLYGLYLSAQGAEVQSLRQDVLANNLANASTPAFKRDLLRVQRHLQEDQRRGQAGNTPDALKGLTGGVTAADTITDFRMGPLQPTNNPLDIALTGRGFLHVAEGDQEYLTRDGRLAVSQEGTLITREHGLTVLSADGSPIGVDPTLPVSIAADGTVSQDGTIVGQIAVVQPESSADLAKAGRNLYVTGGELLDAGTDSRVIQGHLEQSGVNAVSEMVELIDSSRAYEANVNMIRTQDDALARLLTSAAKR